MSFTPLQISSVYPVSVQAYPAEGPKAIPVLLDFSAQDGYLLDFSNQQSRDFISSAQTLFIDNTGIGSDTMTVTMEGTGQVLTILANTQGYYPILCGTIIRITFESASASNVVKVFVLNIPVAPAQWRTSSN